ncbi:MAG: sulfatase-like hydrolase/transferase [Muribaculaceae bacterium]
MEINNILSLSVLSTITILGISETAVAKQPNVIIICADDIGYGDFGCYGAKNISTPNLDKLASCGVRFENAYAPASTSSPTRYALLTGEYAWRKNVGILPGDAANTIDLSKNNLPRQMKSQGYTTAIVGKWHLGLGSKESPVDFNNQIKGGMKDVGFDYSYIFPATNDRVPTIYIENDLTVGLDKNDAIKISYSKKIGNDPTGKDSPETLKLKPLTNYHDGTIVNGISRIGWMTGGNSARWIDENMSENILSKAVEFISKNSNAPFFLYYATHNAHEPRVASSRFAGKSKAGIYGDVIEEFDYCVGEIINTLKEKAIIDNTLIIITSDNGPRIKEAYQDGGLENIGDHDPFSGLRGGKYSLYEGGCKVPFIVSWEGKIKKPFVQKQRFCYMDILSTLTSITNHKKMEGVMNDSRDASELFFKAKAKPYRKYIITQNNNGRLAIRKGNLKLIAPAGKNKAELYDLKNDRSESNNLVDLPKYCRIVEELIGVNSQLKGTK